VYAFAIIAWELAHWTQSYKDVLLGEIKDSVKSGDRMPINPNLCQELRALITASWRHNPHERPTFSEIVKALDSVSRQKTDKETLLSIFDSVSSSRYKPVISDSLTNPSYEVFKENPALVRFWEQSNLDSSGATWKNFFEAIAVLLDLKGSLVLPKHQLRLIFDSEGTDAGPSLDKLYAIIKNEDPKHFFQKYVYDKTLSSGVTPGINLNLI
jgi:hypothetical protein